MVRALPVAALALCLALPAHAEGWALAINGLSYHPNQRDEFREFNAGAGVQFSRERGHVVTRYAAGTMINSMEDRTWYAGAAWSLRAGSRAGHLDAGLFLGAITYPSSGDDVLPALLPMLSIGGARAGVNLLYIPHIDGKTVPTYFVQLIISLGRPRLLGGLKPWRFDP